MTIKNPLLALREAAHLTQAELATQLGITEQTVRRTEQGTYSTIPKSLLLWAHGQTNSKEIQAEYEAWKESVRLELAPIANRVSIYPWDCREHPFKWFRVKFMDQYLQNVSTDKVNSMSGFCKVVAINPRILNNFETSYSDKIPAEVADMLRDMHYLGIEDIREALKTWRSMGLGVKYGD